MFLPEAIGCQIKKPNTRCVILPLKLLVKGVTEIPKSIQAITTIPGCLPELYVKTLLLNASLWPKSIEKSNCYKEASLLGRFHKTRRCYVGLGAGDSD